MSTIAFKDSQTKDNLMRAFAGESQARNRYIFSASKAKNSNLHLVESVFKYTADQELAHAKVFYDYLKELAGNNISIDASYPIDVYDDPLSLLRAAEHNEYQEFEHEYANFSRIAKEEGFMTISASFHMIGQVEKTHGDRFKLFADLIEENRLFESESEEEWLCLNCGHIHKGKRAPDLCPVCKHNQGFFITLSLSPFAK